jgi:hypothetical protein
MLRFPDSVPDSHHATINKKRIRQGFFVLRDFKEIKYVTKNVFASLPRLRFSSKHSGAKTLNRRGGVSSGAAAFIII